MRRSHQHHSDENGGGGAGRLLALLAAVAVIGSAGFFLLRGNKGKPQAPAPPQAHAGKPAPPTTTPHTRPAPAGWPEAPPMVRIPAGTFKMGRSQGDVNDALPVHPVKLDTFWIDATPVTNAQFAQFVNETGYVTVAEQKPRAEDVPRATPEQLVPGSLVFTPPDQPVPLNEFWHWWKYVPGACWKHPEGPGSNIDKRQDHPVVQVCYTDAVAYCAWRSRKEGRTVRLPTEAEWEYAARGGLEQADHSWGNEVKPGGRWVGNIWQGRFPVENTEADGFVRTSPAKAYPPNGYGVYDMGGNVWQWCSDWYRPDTYQQRAGAVVANPTGPADSFDPLEPGQPKRVQRGGSFLCSDQYCFRYKVGTRGKGEVTSASSHIGFRCVMPGE
jgi:formylglycine-generating enzyme